MAVKPGVINGDMPYPYGDTKTYEEVGWLLETCDQVEDWGCGRGFLRNYVPADCYVGVDLGVDLVPTANPFADFSADLRTYRSTTEGLYMRHVLEHNYDWEAILDNALASFTKRFLLVIFTPWSTTQDHEVLTLHGPPEYPMYDPPVPNIAFNRDLFLGELVDFYVEYDQKLTGTQYGQEHVFWISHDAVSPGFADPVKKVVR